MSAFKLADEGIAALATKKYEEAIEKLSKAIENSKSPAWLLARSTAYMETRQLDKALRDAEYAYCTAAERGNDKSRKQMIEAQHRRSVIFFRQKRYADADACAFWSQQLAKGVAVRSADTTSQYIDDKGFYHVTTAQIVPESNEKKTNGESNDAFGRISAIMGQGNSKTPYEKDFQKSQTWRCSIVRFLEALPANDPARKLTVKLVPEKPSLEDKVEEAKKEEHDPEIEAAKAALTQEKPAPKPEANNGPFRSQIYQTDDQITVTLFMKFPNKETADKVEVAFNPKSIIIHGVPRDPPVAHIVPYATINPATCTYRAALMKIELKLGKMQPGKWPNFGQEVSTAPDESALAQPTNVAHQTEAPITVAPTTVKPAPPQQSQSKAPAYPTSSKKGPKDWDNIGADDEDGDADGDPNDFFRKLYAGASPDAQRAMMKSFQESNGTALSTDWESVSKKTVETSPPDGMEAKKW